jgi:hypothetical protein
LTFEKKENFPSTSNELHISMNVDFNKGRLIVASLSSLLTSITRRVLFVMDGAILNVIVVSYEFPSN